MPVVNRSDFAFVYLMYLIGSAFVVDFYAGMTGELTFFHVGEFLAWACLGVYIAFIGAVVVEEE